MDDLRVGDAFHATQDGVEKHDAHSNKEASIVVGLQESRKGDADAFHLANDVRDGNDDETRHGHHAGGFGIEPFADEFGHGEFAVLTQVWRKKRASKRSRRSSP